MLTLESDHNVSQSLRQKSFSLVPKICIRKYGLEESQLTLTNFHLVFSLGI